MPDPLVPIQIDPVQFWTATGTLFAGFGAFARWAIKLYLCRFEEAIKAFEKAQDKMCTAFSSEIKACHDGREKMLEHIIQLSKGKGA